MKAGGDEPVSWKAADPWSNFPIQHQVWCWLVYTAQIWTGFWIMLSGCFAMCVKDKGCLEGLFLFMNTTSC
ncbi:hypothetical protein EB796_002505 [Bugula neritina]|uniref:Uncharacterized protein n=1 Tax=Bugula neritina TaxID=10212 RepID=A0A7J7KM14_BUGNE|nr:hypothetical protein EB796_002505 [Bugula neritina]